MTTPKIYTYHCLCTHLILASTHTLSSLPVRRAPGLDKAIIVPLPPPPRHSSPENSEDEGSDAEDQGNTEAQRSKGKTQRSGKDNETKDLGYTLLLSTARDRRPCIISRADGFEKRYLWRCGRCRLIIGYQLDDAQYASSSNPSASSNLSTNATTTAMATLNVDGEEDGREDKGRGRELVYIFPGGLMTTEEMLAGEEGGGEGC